MTDPGDIFRSGALATLIPPAPASDLAQSSNQGGPLNIRHIRRGHAFVWLTARTSNRTITSTTWSDVDPALRFAIHCSGRPLLIEARVRANTSSGTIYLSIALDDAEVSRVPSGLDQVGATARMSPTLWVAEPTPGLHSVSLVAKVSASGSGTIYCVNDVAVLTAREV